MPGISAIPRRYRDVLLLAAVLLAALALWLAPRAGEKTGELWAVVTVDGQETARLPLSEDARMEIHSEGGYNLLVITGGAASVPEADCYNQVCVHTAPASRAGDLIVCLPHRVVVTIEGDG